MLLSGNHCITVFFCGGQQSPSDWEISQRYGLFEILKPHRPIFITMGILIQNIFDGISQCLDCLILWYFGLRFFAVLWSKAAMGETMDARAEEHVGNLNSIRTASSNPQICL